MKFLRLLAVFTRIGMLSDLAYRANFWFQVLESLLTVATALGAVVVVFSKTDDLGGWRSEELVALVGIYFMVLGMINVVIAPSLQKFMEQVQQGTLDFTLTKPADAKLLVSISEVQVWKLLDVVIGAAIFGMAVARLSTEVGIAETASFGVALIAGGAIVYSVWMLLATLSFWFIRVDNILQVFWSLYWAGRWPIGIYPGWLRFLLTAVVPVAFAVTVPAEAISGRGTVEGLVVALLLGAALLVASRWFWLRGLRQYSGASA